VEQALEWLLTRSLLSRLARRPRGSAAFYLPTGPKSLGLPWGSTSSRFTAGYVIASNRRETENANSRKTSMRLWKALVYWWRQRRERISAQEKLRALVRGGAK